MSACASDTSPLIAFSGIHRLDVLKAVFGEIWVPTMVFREIVTQGDGWIEAGDIQDELAKGNWVHTISLQPSPLLAVLQRELGCSGEAEAISLGLTRQMPVLLDERVGHRVATREGAKVIGSLGVLKMAKNLNVIPRAGPLVQGMASNGIYFKKEIILQFLASLGEI